MGKKIIDYSKYWDKAEPKSISLDYGVILALLNNVPYTHFGKMMAEICMVELGLMKRDETKVFTNKNSEQLKKYLQGKADKSRRAYISAYVGGKFKSTNLDEVLTDNDEPKIEAESSVAKIKRDDKEATQIDNFFFYWNKVHRSNKGPNDVPEFFKNAINNFICVGLNHNYAQLEKMILDNRADYTADEWIRFISDNWEKLAKKIEKKF